VVHHDPDVPGVGPIASLTLDEVKQVRIRNGETLPLLQEVLELLGDHDVWVEVKGLPAAHDRALLAVLDAGPAPHRYAVHSFDHRIIRRLGEARPALARGILLSAYLDDSVSALSGVGATTLWQEWRLVDQDLVNAIHAAECRIIAWTVNEVGDLEHLARLGVDGLCGNYPDRIRVALAARSAAAMV
jgi:glycerophosphoryl diester phosphodiesterase